MTIADPDQQTGHVLGMTANSFSSVSLDPPLIQWCIDVKAHRFSVYSKAQSFAVNILGAGHEDLSRRFSKENAHIVPEEMLLSASHPLRLRDTAGFLACETYETRILGDHLVIVGRVTEFDQSSETGCLTFFRGKYGQLGV